MEWFDSESNVKVGSSWKEADHYKLINGEWVKVFPYILAESNEEVVIPPDPEEIIQGPPVDYTVGTPITEEALQGRSDILYFRDFNDKAVTENWFGSKDGYAWEFNSDHIVEGGGSLRISQRYNSNQPEEVQEMFASTDIAYLRWYRKYEEGYSFPAHKAHGIYAWRNRKKISGDAMNPSDGYAKFSCKISIWGARPHFYTYNPQQPANYGEIIYMNIVPEFRCTAGVWQKWELMVQANTVTNGVGNEDGVMKCWVDGELIGHINDMQFRHTEELVICESTFSAYVNLKEPPVGTEYLWDDQYVIATGRVDQDGTVIVDPPDPVDPVDPPTDPGETTEFHMQVAAYSPGSTLRGFDNTWTNPGSITPSNFDGRAFQRFRLSGNRSQAHLRVSTSTLGTVSVTFSDGSKFELIWDGSQYASSNSNLLAKFNEDDLYFNLNA